MYDHFCPDVDKTMRKLGVEQVQNAIRGRKPSEEKLGLEDFDWELGTDGEPQRVTCPNGQQAEVTAGRKEHRYRAIFETADCDGCSSGVDEASQYMVALFASFWAQLRSSLRPISRLMHSLQPSPAYGDQVLSGESSLSSQSSDLTTSGIWYTIAASYKEVSGMSYAVRMIIPNGSDTVAPWRSASTY